MPRSSWTVLGHFGDTNSGSINSHHILGGEVELTERNWPLPRSAGNGSGILPRPCGWRWIVLENKITLDEKSIHRAKGCSGQLSIQYIYSMNPTDRYFWTSTLQNKAFSNQNKGHLVFRYIIHVYNYNSLHAESQVPVVGFPLHFCCATIWPCSIRGPTSFPGSCRKRSMKRWSFGCPRKLGSKVTNG